MCGFGDGGAFDGVAWTIEPEAEDRALNLPPVTAEVLYYAACEAIRNAARHGRATDANGARPLHLCVQTVWREVLKITVEDDGTGVGSATSPWPGGGQGLALHSTLMAVVGGVLAIESQQGAYARVTLTLPEGIL
jgi:signal transduction histidine kinase